MPVGPVLSLGFVAVLTLLSSVSAVPELTLQIFEVEFDESNGVILTHHSTLDADEGWNGQVVFTYPFGTSKLFGGPEEILEWEEKVEVETQGCESTHSFDVDDETTTVTIQVSNASSSVDIVSRIALTGMVEDVKTYSIPLITTRGEKKRFSLVTSRVNLPVTKTRVIVHLPQGQVLSNYLPLENVTVLSRGSSQQSVFWSLEEGAPQEARIFVEFGTKGKIGRLMILVIVVVVMGVVLAALKFLLILDEESLTY